MKVPSINGDSARSWIFSFVFINEENKSKEIQGKTVLSFTKFVLGSFCLGGFWLGGFCPDTLFMTGSQHFSPCEIQFPLVYDRGQCAESSYLKLKFNGLFQKISPPPPPTPRRRLWTTLNWIPKNFRISKKDSGSLRRIPNPDGWNSWGIPEFCKILNGFPRIPVKIHRILGKFMEFQSGSPSIYYRIPVSSIGGVWIFSGIAQWIHHK